MLLFFRLLWVLRAAGRRFLLFTLLVLARLLDVCLPLALDIIRSGGCRGRACGGRSGGRYSRHRLDRGEHPELLKAVAKASLDVQKVMSLCEGVPVDERAIAVRVAFLVELQALLDVIQGRPRSSRILALSLVDDRGRLVRAPRVVARLLLHDLHPLLPDQLVLLKRPLGSELPLGLVVLAALLVFGLQTLVQLELPRPKLADTLPLVELALD